jgi:hypothetical protein
MAHWAAVINGGPRNCPLRPLSRSDVFGPASCRRNRACLIVALFAARLLLYCPSPIRSGIRKRTRVCGPTSSGISLEYVARDNPSRRRFCFVRLRSPVGHWCSDANPTATVIGEKSRLHSKSPDFGYRSVSGGRIRTITLRLGSRSNRNALQSNLIVLCRCLHLCR